MASKNKGEILDLLKGFKTLALTGHFGVDSTHLETKEKFRSKKGDSPVVEIRIAHKRPSK